MVWPEEFLQVGDMSLPFSIVDAHQHFWDPATNYHPWLRDDPPIAFRYGDYTALKQPYLPTHYLADCAPYKIDRSVYIETEWDPTDPVGEIDWVARLREETGFPTVAVAQAWLDRADCAAVLEAHARQPFVRGVRHKPRANAGPTDRTPGGMADANWRAGYAHLAGLGLHFELQTPWWHLHEAAALARAVPDTAIILNHCGMPSDRSPEGMSGWKAAMRLAAECPNIAVKISGIGRKGVPWTAADNRDIVLTIIDLFGARRAMFASNFPVDGLCASFATIFDGFEAITRDFGDADRRALFRDNALHHYRID